MNSTTISQQNSTLNEKSNPKNKRWGIFGAVIYTIIIVILIFMKLLSAMEPEKEPGGVMASFGNVEIAGGASSETEEVVSDPVTKETKTEEVETNDDIKSTAVNADPKPDKPSKETDGPKGLSADDFFKGTGTGKGDGKEGNENGKKDGLGTVGGGGDGKSGTGDGVEDGKGGRKCKTNCTCSGVNGDWKEAGTAWVTIIIAPDGKVTKAEMAKKGDTKDEKNYTALNSFAIGNQKKIAIECVKNRVYEASGSTTMQIVPIVFKYR